MTLAERVKQTIEVQCPVTFSLYAGYGLEGGKPVHYPTGVQVTERRNDSGRCTFAEYKYADDSTLTYRFHPTRGYTLTCKGATK